MPVYQFVCEKHGAFEKITIRAEWDDIRCPKCGVKSKVDKRMRRPLDRGRPITGGVNLGRPYSAFTELIFSRERG